MSRRNRRPPTGTAAVPETDPALDDDLAPEPAQPDGAAPEADPPTDGAEAPAPPALAQKDPVAAEPPDGDPVPEGFAHLEHDDPTASATVSGFRYVADEAGRFLVRVEHALALIAHGFRVPARSTAPDA